MPDIDCFGCLSTSINGCHYNHTYTVPDGITHGFVDGKTSHPGEEEAEFTMSSRLCELNWFSTESSWGFRACDEIFWVGKINADN
jgi:hypothetical protein